MSTAFRTIADGCPGIIQAMENAGVRRFVRQTSLGYGDSRKVLDLFIFKYIIAPFILRKVFKGHQLRDRIVLLNTARYTIKPIN